MSKPLHTDTYCPPDTNYEEAMKKRQRTAENLGRMTHHWVADLNEGVKGTGTDRKPEDMTIVKED